MSRPVLRNKLCDMLGIEYPILSAGMGPSLVGEKTGAPVDLVVAVSEAGGLGVLGAAGFSVEEMRSAIHEIRERTDKPFGVDLLLPSSIVDAGDQDITGQDEIPLSDLIKTLPEAHYNWIMRIRDEMNLPDVEIALKLNSTTTRPHAAVKACIEEKVPLFCSGLGNP
ncbi:nitronate monooxygenase, partial [bacterium]|nr:nitronate monooxygenase [bacterium]